MAVKTTVYLDADDYRRLKAIARAQATTPAALLRKAVAEYTEAHARRPAPSSIGVGHSAKGNVSEKAEELLAGMGRT